MTPDAQQVLPQMSFSLLDDKAKNKPLATGGNVFRFSNTPRMVRGPAFLRQQSIGLAFHVRRLRRWKQKATTIL